MTELVTVDTIIDYLKDCVEQRLPIGPDVWLDAAQKLVALSSDESERLFELQHELAVIKMQQMEDGATAAKAKIFAEAFPEYKDMQKQKARIEQIQEMVRIAKLQARLRTEEMRSY